MLANKLFFPVDQRLKNFDISPVYSGIFICAFLSRAVSYLYF